ncbi:UbiA-like polyprenyltransferase [Anaeromyxobacter oryzae]|uniref:4-hydroxybenzoate octaprenyltransferase n=1 Tax=Anaeromyxobacter oryzae TaxID=2918170 RepID=A0ABN6MUG8_9BACT|nr:UbiA-like polyprenyltransferase [Anaeromyxobacter oryzae]BDG03103.1 4-hydroxybenzoate octaprenyltransferase [Anaeromyxobacter oryzae]
MSARPQAGEAAPPLRPNGVVALARMVKLSHSLFALPFVAAAVVLVARDARLEPLRLALVAVAVVAARTAAMAMNRIADRAFDARNPRTMRRELVTGEVSPAAAWALLLGSGAAFVLAAALISPLCGILAVPVLGILLGYSYAKRFTWACHLWLGVAQALAPIGVALALTGGAPAASVVLGVGVGAWIAGFDVFYALQDLDYDRGVGLSSIPARFGVRGALAWARGLHVVAVLCVFAAGALAGRGPGWVAGAAILAATIVGEHLHVAPRGQLRPERINVAFFNYNAFASVAFALCALGDLAIR